MTRPDYEWPAATQTRRGYDAAAEVYAEHLSNELDGKPLDRALLALFAEEVGPGAEVLDVGCGPGHITAHLAGLGLKAIGLDLSAGMIDVARRRHPELTFDVGSVLDLPPSGRFAGVVAMYSLIHFDLDTLQVALERIRGALRPGAPVLVTFHIGEEVRHIEELFGAAVTLDFTFFTVEDVLVRLDRAGFVVESATTRAPYPEAEVATRRAYLLARKVGNGGQ